MSQDILMSSYTLGGLTLPNRVVMAPMTRSRARQPDDVPTEMNARYYAQRATAGLIVSEGTQISQQAKGYPMTPGIFSSAQIEGWKGVTKAVHDHGGRIFAQLWHTGRISHPKVNGLQPVAPSALIAKETVTFIANSDGSVSPITVETPRALSVAEIRQTIDDYATAAKNAVAAGFDGIELHAANGYLVDQFLRSESNQRTDGYGGSIANRTRFLREVTEALVGAIGAERVGVRLSPFLNINGISDETPTDTFLAAAKVLGEIGVVYLHLSESSAYGGDTIPAPDVFLEAQRKVFDGTVIICGGFTGERARRALAGGLADLIGFGKPFIANPDLVRRLAEDLPLAVAERSSFFGGGEQGYTDFPTYRAA